MLKPIILIAICTLLLATSTYAASLSVTIENTKGKKVQDAVVYAIPEEGPAVPAPQTGKTVIDQKDKEFYPYVTAVPVGTEVYFDNNDKIRHHVYSFSETKKFEIPLSSGLSPEPVLFDKPGVAAIGCNIHDWMRAFVFVSESPYFAISDSRGETRIDNLPPGQYHVEVWHPDLRGKTTKYRQQLTIESQNDQPTMAFKIKQKKSWKTWQAPGASGSYK